MNISRRTAYITNVMKKQLSFRHATGKVVVSKFEKEKYFELVRWELLQHKNLKYIMVLGNEALTCLTGEVKITSWRGSVLKRTLKYFDEDKQEFIEREFIIVCANNPAHVLRNPLEEVPFRIDCAKLRRVILGQHQFWEPEIRYDMSPSEITLELDKIQDEKKPTATDIESISGETACIGFANSIHHGISIPFRDKTKNLYSRVDEMAIRRRVQGVYKDPDIQFVAQNGMFDSYWMWYKDKIRIYKIWFDTMLAHHTLYSQLPHGLGFLTTQYTDHPYYKDEIKEWREGGDIGTFWRYNGKDCCHTLEVAFAELKELKAQGLDQFFFDHVMRLQPHLVRMVVGGIQVDVSLKEKITEELIDDVDEKLEAFHEATRVATGDPDAEYNPNSPAQLSKLFFQDLKLVGRGQSTGAENRDRILNHPATNDNCKEVIHKLDAYKTEHKFLSVYASSKLDDDDRIRCEYKQTGVQSAPGRLSSSKVMWGTGMNLQNQPYRALKMYVADPGYQFGYFDLAQAEARFVGWDAGIESWIEQFERARLHGDYDAHRALASEMFKVPYDEVPTFDHYDTSKGYIPPEGFSDGDITIRYTAKRCRHGLNYRMMWQRLATVLKIPLGEAKRLWLLYHSVNPELQEWWGELEHEAKTKGVLYNAFGRRLTIMQRITDDALESIVAFKPQSTIGDHVCKIIYKSESHPDWPIDARMALNIHDALICLARPEHIKTCLSIMKLYAEEPIMVKGREMIIPADCKVSEADETGLHRWSNLVDVHDIEKAKAA